MFNSLLLHVNLKILACVNKQDKKQHASLQCMKTMLTVPVKIDNEAHLLWHVLDNYIVLGYTLLSGPVLIEKTDILYQYT